MYLTSFSNILKQGQLPEDYEPSDTDILCGRGKACLEHPGNKTFSEVVRANAQKYIEAPKRVYKSSLVASVLDSLKESGVRFIKQDKHSKLYCELSHDQAHAKTGQAIRHLLKNDTPPAGRKMAKKTLTVDTESSRKRRSKAFAKISRDSISKFVSQELSSQAEITSSKIISAAFEISDAMGSIEEPLSLSSETRIERADIRRLFEILSEDYSCP
jgi:superfamily II DNA helicase RecQ